MALSASGVKQRGRETHEGPGSPPWPQQHQWIALGEPCRQRRAHVHSPAAAGPQLAGAVCSVLPLQGEAL